MMRALRIVDNQRWGLLNGHEILRSVRREHDSRGLQAY